MLYRATGFSFVVLCLLVSVSFLGAQKNIVVGVDTTYPPMESLDNSGKPIGLDIDIMNAAAEAAGFTVSFRSVGWDYIFEQLRQGRIDAVISDVTVLEWRKATMDFSISYYNSPQILVVPRTAVGIGSLEDLRGKKVGVLSGSVAASVLKQDSEKYGVVCVEYYEDPYNDLILGKLDGMIWESVAVATSMKDPKIAAKIREAAICPFVEQTAVAVKKGNSDVLKLVNNGLKAISDSGQLAKLIQKWIK